jgi:integrase
VHLHDLRHSFASVAAAGGMGLPIIGKMLGHTQPQQRRDMLIWPAIQSKRPPRSWPAK